jgi:hypothetical protein
MQKNLPEIEEKNGEKSWVTSCKQTDRLLYEPSQCKTLKEIIPIRAFFKTRVVLKKALEKPAFGPFSP